MIESSWASVVDHRCAKKSRVGFEFVSEWGSEGALLGQFSHLIDVALDDEGEVYVSDAGNN